MAKRSSQTAQIQQLQGENIELQERLAALEMALEADGWRMLTMQADQEFSREGLRLITELSRIMSLKNPLIKRGVQVQRLYVWGQGWNVKASDPDVQGVLDAFMKDPKNQVELTSHQARMQKETEQTTDGNTFFVFFVNALTGRVRVRTFQFEEVIEIVCDPQDAKSPWYYKRSWSEQTLDAGSGAIATMVKTAYYPDWRYNPVNKPASIGSYPVRWENPVYHIKTGGFSNWKFGCSEIYAAIDWSRAYKEFLEDWASIVRAYRRFAFQLSTPGGKSAIAAAKAKLGTTYGAGGLGAETNPAPVVGSTFVAGDNVNLTPVRTSGATVAAEDGRRLLLMVAAAVGLPETFFGDVSVGTLATASSLDRPTELAMRDRQTFWQDIFQAIFDFVLLWAVKAPRGPLRGLGTVVVERDGDEISETVDWGDVDAHIDIDFPPIRSEALDAQMRAIVSAATLDGKAPAGTLDLMTTARLMLVALGVDDIDAILQKLFDEEGRALNPVGQGVDGTNGSDATDGATDGAAVEAMMVRAVRELRDALVRLREGVE
jgi:hypothetical protein